MNRAESTPRRFLPACIAVIAALATVACQSEYRKHMDLGKELARAKRTDEALKEFELAAQAAPAEAKPYYEMGKIYRSQKKWPEAEKVLRKSLEIDPEYPHSYPDLMEVLIAMGKFEEAARIGTTALGIPSVKADIKESRAVQEQMAAIEKARKTKPPEPPAPKAAPTPGPAPADGATSGPSAPPARRRATAWTRTRRRC